DRHVLAARVGGGGKGLPPLGQNARVEPARQSVALKFAYLLDPRAGRRSLRSSRSSRRLPGHRTDTVVCRLEPVEPRVGVRRPHAEVRSSAQARLPITFRNRGDVDRRRPARRLVRCGGGPLALSRTEGHPCRMSARSTGNLPAELTSFVGRRTELIQIKGLLASARLVTLTGMGGIGKTRLARRLAGEVRRTFPDGVWLVELADLHQGTLLPQAIGAALGVRDESSDPVGTLIDHLRSRRCLLVLDNCE